MRGCRAVGTVSVGDKDLFDRPHGLVRPTKRWIKSSRWMKREHLPRHAQAQVGHFMNAHG